MVWLVLLVAGAAVLAPAALARPSAYTAVEQVYTNTGTIPPCRFSSAELEAALKQAPTYDVEYFGDFTGAINTALSDRADGVCGSRRSIAALHETGLHRIRPGALPASVTSGTYGSIPLALLLTMILLGIGLVGGAGWLVLRSRSGAGRLPGQISR